MLVGVVFEAVVARTRATHPIIKTFDETDLDVDVVAEISRMNVSKAWH